MCWRKGTQRRLRKTSAASTEIMSEHKSHLAEQAEGRDLNWWGTKWAKAIGGKWYVSHKWLCPEAFWVPRKHSSTAEVRQTAWSVGLETRTKQQTACGRPWMSFKLRSSLVLFVLQHEVEGHRHQVERNWGPWQGGSAPPSLGPDEFRECQTRGLQDLSQNALWELVWPWPLLMATVSGEC